MTVSTIPEAPGSELPAGPYLCFQLKHIGDFLMTLPAVGRLRQARPDDKLGMVVAPAVAELAHSHPWVDEVFVLDRTGGPLNNFRLARAIACEKYGTTFIFDGQTRSIVTAALAGIKNRIGASGLYPLGGAAPLFSRDIYLGDDLRLESQARRGQRMAELALGLKSGPPLRPPLPELSRDDLDQAEGLLAELSGDGPLIGLTLAGRQHEKSWSLAHFVELCRLFYSEMRARLFVTGGPAESAMAQALAKAAGVPVADFCGRTGLKSVIALAHRSNLFITIDTGTSHLAALTETPLISIFIWTNPAQWPPQSPLARILCYDWALKRFGLKPDDGPWEVAPVVTPEMVFNTAAEILNHRSRLEES